MTHINCTYAELERLAYASGSDKAPIMAKLAEFETGFLAAETAVVHIEEACSSIPDEDFLQDLIDKCRAMVKGRITKRDLEALAESLEELQNQIAQSSEYAHDELRKALRAMQL